MKSIIQPDECRCYLCGINRYEHLDKHHIFGGYNRSKSEEYGLFVFLHHSTCHIFGKHSVHNDYEVMEDLRRNAQLKAMDYYNWSENDFIGIFGRSWL